MAEFVRIWNESTQEYVEYDISPPELPDSIVVPVTPISISRDINVGVIQKIIDINDITVSAQSVTVDQILRPIAIERSETRDISVQVSSATTLDVSASRNEILVSRSGVGRQGAPGRDGRDSTLVFEGADTYKIGDLVSFVGKIFSAKVDLDGSVVPLEDPFENRFWTELATAQLIEDLPLTSGYEFSNQQELNRVLPLVEFGDSLKLLEGDDEFLDLDIFSETGQREVISVGRRVFDNDGFEFGVPIPTDYLVVAGTGVDPNLGFFLFIERSDGRALTPAAVAIGLGGKYWWSNITRRYNSFYRKLVDIYSRENIRFWS